MAEEKSSESHLSSPTGGQGACLIHLTTFIAASQKIVFDLSRSVDLHKQSMTKYNERIIAGTQSGLMTEGQTVTWRARHLFKNRQLQVKITAMQPYTYFCDEQIKGDFASMKHEHYFKPCEGGTLMTDQFYFTSPFGLLGRLANALFLKKYMTRLLVKRNTTIKHTAEIKNIQA